MCLLLSQCEEVRGMRGVSTLIALLKTTVRLYIKLWTWPLVFFYHLLKSSLFPPRDDNVATTNNYAAADNYHTLYDGSADHQRRRHVSLPTSLRR